jgi:hypothetical protein
VRVALVSLVLSALIAPAASAAAPKTCKSPKPVFRDGQVRIWKGVGRYHEQRWWICSRSIRKPKLWNDQGPFFVEDTEWTFRRFGSRIGYSWTWDNGEDSGWEIGWVGTHTGRLHAFVVSVDDRNDTQGIQGVAVAPDGSVAFLELVDVTAPGSTESTAAQRIAVCRLGRKDLGKPRNVARIDENNVDPKTLTFDGEMVTWLTTDGQPGAVQLR